MEHQQLVPETSASFLGRGVSRQPMPTDHSGLNKFESRAAPGYQVLSRAIVDMMRALDRERAEDDTTKLVVPFRLVSTFAERPELQLSLEQCLKADCQDFPLAHAAAVSGAGGMGKTQLVLKYIADNAKMYNAILWIDAENPETIGGSFRRCCDALKIPCDSGRGVSMSLADLPVIQCLLEWLKG